MVAIMNEESDPRLTALFAAYSPVIAEEPFLGRARSAVACQQRRLRTRSITSYSAIALVGGCIAVASSAIVVEWISLLNDQLIRWTDALSPLASQLLTYGTTCVVAILGRHRIRAFLAPW